MLKKEFVDSLVLLDDEGDYERTKEYLQQETFSQMAKMLEENKKYVITVNSTVKHEPYTTYPEMVYKIMVEEI